MAQKNNFIYYSDSYLQVASYSMSTWALLDFFSLHVQQVLQHNFELFANNFERSFSGMPKRRALHETILEVTKALINSILCGLCTHKISYFGYSLLHFKGL